jgi:protocatechuate 3,4-dioxygenase beta subunit
MFFPGEPLNEHDAILNAVRDPQARSRCIAELAPTAHGAGRNDSQRQDALVYDYQLVVRGRSSTPGLP